MNFSGFRRRRAPSVIIVSLIDVLIVVMIFLMVTTTFRNQQQPELKIALPEAQSARPGAGDTKPMIVTVATNFPFFYVENRAVTFDQLQNELQTAVKRDPKLKLSIKADKLAPWGEVLRLIDAARVAQVGSINTMTLKPGGL